MQHAGVMSTRRQVGGRLGSYIRAKNPTPQQIQAFLSDLLADDELLNPMKDVVVRPSFAALRESVGTGGGAYQRDALLQELLRLYLPHVVDEVGQLISGMLDLPACKTIYTTAAPERKLIKPVAPDLAAPPRAPLMRQPTSDVHWGWTGYDSSQEFPQTGAKQHDRIAQQFKAASDVDAAKQVRANFANVIWIIGLLGIIGLFVGQAVTNYQPGTTNGTYDATGQQRR